MTVLLFAGDDYYPSGGWSDYQGEYETIEAAKAWIDAQVEITHVPEHVRPPHPFGALVASTNPSDDDNKPRLIPARDHVKAPFNWAHIVADGRVVAEWVDWCHDGKWEGGWEDTEEGHA